MIIYILFPNDTEEHCIYENRQLGEFSYPKIPLKNGLFTRKEIFYKKQGFDILLKLISNNDIKKLEVIRIITEKGRKLTIEKFLDSLTNAEMR